MLTLDEKIGQMLMVGFDGKVAPLHVLDWLRNGRIGGVYLFARNVESPAQVKQLVDACRAAAKFPILVGIDQEGGAVARLRDGFSESPGAMALGASRDTQLAEDVALMLGRELAALGINWNFAPVADVAHRMANPSVGTRSVGMDKDLVSDFVVAQIRGFRRAGVAATAKHFPGLGNSVIDTHDALAKISGSLEYLYDEDLIPFRAAIKANVPCIMTTHVMFEEMDDRYPATLSPRVINGLLRRELGYDGAVCSDCMEMKAITTGWGAGESAVLAALAGVDILLFSHSRDKQEAAYGALLQAACTGRISTERIDKAVARIGALKRRCQLRKQPSLRVVACEAHLSLTRKAGRAGLVQLQSSGRRPDAFRRSRVFCIEFATQEMSDAKAVGAGTALAGCLRRRLPHAECLLVDRESEIEKILARCDSHISASDLLIVATRDAHLLPWQARAAQAAVDRHSGAILLCLRSPYDASVISGAATILCSNGDSAPSLEAAVDAICNEYVPSGALTIDLERAS